MKPAIRIEGVAVIERRLSAMEKALTRKTLMPIMKGALQPMADQMRDTAARDTGELAESCAVSEQLSAAQENAHEPIAALEVFVGPGPLAQAIQEEFGNFKQDARPFIRPAYDAHIDRAIREVAKAGIAIALDATKKG